MIIVPCSLNLMNTSQILCKFGLVWTHSETIVCWKNQGAERDRYFFEHVKVLWVKCLPPSFPVSLQHIPQGDISWINYLHRIHWDKRVTRRDSGLGKGPSFFLFPYGDCGTHHLSFKKKKGGTENKYWKSYKFPFLQFLFGSHGDSRTMSAYFQ